MRQPYRIEVEHFDVQKHIVVDVFWARCQSDKALDYFLVLEPKLKTHKVFHMCFLQPGFSGQPATSRRLSELGQVHGLPLP